MEITYLKLNELVPYEKNPRKISEEAIEKVAGSIKAHGFNQPIVVNQENVICVGHTRWQAAKKLGLDTVPVFKKEMTDSQFKKYNIADNKTGEFSMWDIEGLSNIIYEMTNEEGDALSLETEHIGFSEKEIISMLDYTELENTSVNDPKEEWIDMPEHNNKQVKPWKTLSVHFDNQDDMNDFSKKLNLKIEKNTKSTWYPKKEKDNHVDKIWIDE